VATTVESITKQVDAWHAITTPEQIQELNISKPLLSVNNTIITIKEQSKQIVIIEFQYFF